MTVGLLPLIDKATDAGLRGFNNVSDPTDLFAAS